MKDTLKIIVISALATAAFIKAAPAVADPLPLQNVSVVHTTDLDLTSKAGRTARYFQTVFGPFDITDPANTCAPPSPAPAGCSTATLSEVDSNIVKAPGVKPKPKKKKKKH